MENLKTTMEYFNKNDDELLVTNSDGYTKEECLLFDDGEEVIFFDNEKEMQDEEYDFESYIKSKRYEIKAMVKTINERIAVVLV